MMMMSYREVAQLVSTDVFLAFKYISLRHSLKEH